MLECFQDNLMTEIQSLFSSDPKCIQGLGITRIDYITQKLDEGYTKVSYGEGETVPGDGHLYGTQRIRYGWFFVPDEPASERGYGLCAVRLTSPEGFGFATTEFIHEFTSLPSYKEFLRNYQIQITHHGTTENLLVYLHSLPTSKQAYPWITSGTPRIPLDKFSSDP